MSRRVFLPLLGATATFAAALFSPFAAAARVYGGADRDVPLARFEDALCPGIVGVQQDSAETMVGLIRQNAAELGLPLADPATCEPNLLVVVMDDSEGYLKDLRKRRPYLFGRLGNAELQALFDTPGPAHTWTQVVTASRDGHPIYESRSLTELPRTTMMEAHSLIYVPVRRDIASAMVLLEKKAVQGLSVAQLADYATMQGLSADQAERLEAPGDTILRLFAAGAESKPPGLTRSDKIFLKTLYSTMPNNPAAITLSLADARIASGKTAE